MDPIVTADDPTLSAAFEQLSAEEADASTQTATPQPAPDSAPPSQPAPETAPTTSPTPETKPEGTPATAKPEQTKEPSKYEKAASRQADAWKQINTEKDEVRSLRKQLDTDREALKAERQALEEEKAKASQPKYKPEDYDAYAEKCEAEGKLELAEAARAAAEELRKNPPKPIDTKAQEEEFKAKQKEWHGKAAVDFPKIIVKESDEFKSLAKLIGEIPQIQTDPQMMYYAARLATAEVASARVPTMEKELGEARAKIKELEGKLQVPTDGIVSGVTGEKSFEQKTEGEQYAEVEALAKELDRTGSFR